MLLLLTACYASAAASSAGPWPVPTGSSTSGWSSLGNHRYRIDVTAAPGAVVQALVPWRRRDAYVATSDTLIVAANGSATGPPVSKCFRNATATTATSASLVFTADAGSAAYYLYYLPFNTCEYAGGACQYSADVTYASQQHCSDPPWWPPGTPQAQPTAVAYEGATAFDAFTDMERPMSAAELAAFAASASTPGGLGVVLIAEAAESSARMWGGGGSGGSGGGNATAPFCVYAAAAGGYYLKTGGDPAVRAGWDQGHSDKCCSTGASDCVWFATAAACAAFPPAQCRACRASDSDMGCPSWAGAPSTGVLLPYKYAALPPASLARLSATLRRNQNFSFQVLALGPPDTPLVVSAVTFLPAAPPGLTLGCLSTQAVDFWGRASALQPTVYGSLPLWMTVAVDRAAPAGGAPLAVTVLVTLQHPPTNASTTLPVALQLTVAGEQPPLPDGADSLPRPHWLNSRLAADDTSVPRPYSPLAVNASSGLPALFTMHGKAVEVGAAGLPTSILTSGPSASPAVDAARGSTQVLGQGGVLLVVTANATPAAGAAAPLLFPAWATTAWAGNASQWSWTAAACDSTGAACLTVSGSLDFTGYLALDLALALGPLASPSTRLALELSAPAAPENLLYGMGLGRHGGLFAKLFPDAAAAQLDWRWDGINGNNGVWLGSTTGGFLLKAKGQDPLWQASVPYDSRQAPPAPPAWANAGQGGIRVTRAGVATAYTGLLPPAAAAGAAVASLQASLLVTPVHNLNLTHHFSLRYAQLDAPPLNYSFLAASGATVVNVHQGNAVNPWINYPYLTNPAMGAAAAACHALGMRFSIYNTMRELSNRCAETYVLRALGETYVGGSGAQGADWLKEHVGADFAAAWSTPIPALDNSSSSAGGRVLDAAMRVVALSRWNNYYVEGIQQMTRDFALDGIYLDEIAYDRVTMLRMRKLLDAKGGVIDHHSDSGAFCVSPAMIYAEHYPFLDKLWYGEGFDYGAATPDYWLVEMSGLVWGLTADMLRYPGMTPYHFRGMLFGESNRWQGGMDPAAVAADPFCPLALWRLWGELGIAAATLHGFWLEEALGPAALPVATNASAAVKVTTYALPQRALVVVASFAPAPLTVALTFNSSILGLPGSLQGYCLHAPALPPFQPAAATLALNQSFLVAPGQGWIFVVQPC